MLDVLRTWFRRYFSDEQAVYLFVVLASGLLVILLVGSMLAPVLAALVVAYLLQGMINTAQRKGMGKQLAFYGIYTLFVSLLLLSLVVLLPMIWKQTLALVQVQLPKLLAATEAWMRHLPSRYPDMISDAQVVQLIDGMRAELADLGQQMVTASFALLPGILDVMIFLVLLPLLVFFDYTGTLTPATESSINRLFYKFPAAGIRALTLIYYNAFKLWLKKTPFYDHPMEQQNNHDH